MGLDTNFGQAFAKSQIATGIKIPLSGKVFISVKDKDKKLIFKISKKLEDLGFSIICTKGTSEYLKKRNIKLSLVNKVREGRPHIVDLIKNKEIDLIFNTTEGNQSISDSFSLRQAALHSNIPYYTTIAGCNAIVMAIEKLILEKLSIKSLQSY